MASQLFFHYTSTAGANAIRNEGLLRSNNGVMLSTLKPEDHTRDDILHSIHGNNIPAQFKNRADNIVVVNASTLDTSKLSQVKPNLFKYTGDIRISPSDVRDKPRCSNYGGNSWNPSTQGSTNGGHAGRSNSWNSSTKGTWNGNTTGSANGWNSSTQYPTNSSTLGLSGSRGQLLYHYTSTAGANAIRKEGLLRSNNGVMLSTLKPEDHTRDDILQSIHGNSIPAQFQNRADNLVVVNASTLDTSKLSQIKPNLFKYAGDIRISPSDVRDKPRCTNHGGKGWNSAGQGTWNGNTTGASQSTASQPSKFFYYYTNESTAAQLKSSGRTASNCNILLTTMAPESYFRSQILDALYGKNYDRNLYAAWADWCTKIDSSKLNIKNLKQIRNGVYEYSNSITVNANDVMDKPECNQGSSSSGQDDFLYHYTDGSGAQAIKQAGYLKKSGASGAFGVGVYMTNLRPTDFFREDILQNNYGGIKTAFKGRADYVVRVNKKNLDQSKLRQYGANVTKDGSRQIFVYGDEIQVSSNDISDKPKCFRAK